MGCPCVEDPERIPISLWLSLGKGCRQWLREIFLALDEPVSYDYPFQKELGRMALRRVRRERVLGPLPFPRSSYIR